MNRFFNPLLPLSILIGIISGLVYFPVLGFDFVNWDDSGYVTQNEQLTALDIEFFLLAMRSLEMSNWHPMTWVSYALDYSLWGRVATGFHLSNVILHVLNTILVTWITGYLALRRVALKQGQGLVLLLAASVGVIFGLHPQHVESVAWVSQRKDVLYALFWLVALLFYIGYQQAPRTSSRIAYFLLSLGAFALSLMSKPSGVTLPLVLLLMDYYPLRRVARNNWQNLGSLLLEKVPYFVLSLVAGILTLVAQSQESAMDANLYLSLGERFLNAVNAVVFYLYKFLFPANLSPFYSLDRVDLFVPVSSNVSVLILLLITVSTVFFRKKQPVLLFAWIFFLVTLLPVSGLVQVGGAMAADRYMYLPMIGPAVVFAVLVSYLVIPGRSFIRWLTMLGMTALVVMMLILTTMQISIWKNSVSLWEHVLRIDPISSLAHFNLGDYYRSHGDLQKAAFHWNRVIEIMPNHSEALNQLGSIYLLNNQIQPALRMYEQSVSADENNLEAHYNLALVYERIGDFPAALVHYRAFLERASEYYGYLIPLVDSKVKELSRIPQK